MEPEIVFLFYIGLVLIIQRLRAASPAAWTTTGLAAVGVVLLYATTLYNPFEGCRLTDIVLWIAKPVVDAFIVLPRGSGATVPERLCNILWIVVAADGTLHLTSKACAKLGTWTGVNTSNGGCQSSNLGPLTLPLASATTTSIIPTPGVMILSREHLSEELKRLLSTPPTPAAVAAVTAQPHLPVREAEELEVLKDQVADDSAKIEDLKEGQQAVLDMLLDLTARIPQLVEGAVSKCWETGANVAQAAVATTTTLTTPAGNAPDRRRRRRQKVESQKESGSSSSSSSDSSSNASSDESDGEVPGEEGSVNVVTTKKIQKKKPARPNSPRTTNQLPEATREKLRNQDTLEGVKETLRELVEWRKAEEKRRKELTEAEKEMSKAELLRQQAEKNYEKRYGPRDDSKLTEEEKAMSRPELLRKLRSEDHQRWVARQAKLGKKIVKCECGGDKVEGAFHYCARLWTGQTRRARGVPVQEEVVAKQQGRGGLHISRQFAVDEERLRREHAEMTKMIEKLDAAKVQDHPMTGGPANTVNMITNAASSSTGERMRGVTNGPATCLFH
jgi:hypothetical protein